jgi:hypothetical protein
MGHPGAVLLFAGPLFLPGALPSEQVTASVSPSRIEDIAARDTHLVDVITAGEEQKSSLDQCAASDDALLCQALVSAVNVGAVIGSAFTGW